MNPGMRLVLAALFAWPLASTSQGHAAAPPATAQRQAPTTVCSITTEQVGAAFGRSSEFVAAENGVAYVNVGYALQVVDARQQPSLKHIIDIGTYSYVAALHNGVAYVAESSTGGLRIFDVSDPLSPTLRGTYMGLPWVDDVAIAGDLAYVIGHPAGSSSGSALHIVDVRDLDAPVLRGSYPLSPVLGQVEINNNVAYITSLQGGLQLFDVSDPAAPALLSTLPIGEASGLAVTSGFAYVAGSGKLYAVDVTNPANPLIRGALAIDAIAHHVEIQGSLAFVAARSAGLLAVDIGAPAQPTLRSTYPVKGGAYDVAVSGSVAYVAAGASGLELVDIADANSPAALARYSPPNESLDVFVEGATAYVADGSAGLKVVDVADPRWPTPRFVYDTPGAANAVRVVGDRIYIADGPAGLLVFNRSDPQNITLSGFYDTPGYAASVALDGNYLYVADGSSLQILDTRPAGNPALAATYDLNIEDVSVANGRAFAVGGSTLTILDVQNPAQPRLISSNELPILQARRVRAVGDTVYIVGMVNGQQKYEGPSDVLLILDVQNPAAPRELGRFAGGFHPIRAALAVADGRAITSDAIFDVRDPAQARRLGGVASAANIHLLGDFVYAARIEQGIAIERLVERPCSATQLLPLVSR